MFSESGVDLSPLCLFPSIAIVSLSASFSSLKKDKITVILDDSGERLVSFAPKFYPFIDNGWATNIHKSQGVTVDDVKKLGSFEEYRNLAYVAMSRHRQSLEVFVSKLDFWRDEKIIDRLSRVQEKLSAVDYLNPEQIKEHLQNDAKILWHEKKIQQGRDLWNAVKVTARSAMGQAFGSGKDEVSVDKVAEKNIVDFANSEEKRSAEMFKFRESLPAARAAFEAAHKNKYRDVCEFFEFQTRFGRSPLEEDKTTISLMGDELTRLAGRLYQEKAVKDGVLPKHTDISKLAYKEFDLRPQIEKSLANQIMVEYKVALDTAQIMAKLMISQEDLSDQKLNKADEAICLDLAQFAETRMKELAREIAGGASPSAGNHNSNLTPNQPHSNP